MAKRSTSTKARKRNPETEYYTSEQYKPYVMAIGQIALAWNDLHEQIGDIFLKVTIEYMPEEDFFVAGWQSLSTDRAKRAFLRSGMGTLHPKHERWVKEVIWLLGQADRLEEDRNNAIHAPLIWFPAEAEEHGLKGGVQPHRISMNKRALNLSNKDLLTEFRWIRDAIIVIRDYAYDLYEAWEWGKEIRRSLPRRPSLPNRGHKSRRLVRPSDRPIQLPLLPEASQE